MMYPKICEGISSGESVKPAPYLNNQLESNYININFQLVSKASQNIEVSESENTKQGDEDTSVSASDTVVNQSSKVDPFIARFINSEKLDEMLSSSSEEFINTVNLC